MTTRPRQGKPRKTRPVRAAEELSAVSVHLHYEVQMMHATATRLAADTDDELLRNALLESFVVHARALLHFFQPAGLVHDDDVLCEDFLGGMQRPSEIDQHLDGLAIRDRAGKEIAHLTYARLDVVPEEKGWDITAIHRALMLAVLVFAEHAPGRCLDARWAGLQEQARSVRRSR